MNSPDDITDELILRDGRHLAYCTTGGPHSPSVIWFDGTPGSRLTTIFADQLGPRLELRVATFDRPGYGRSDPQPDRTVADVTADVAQLTEHLGWDQWLAVGYSGGAPHALACGALLADQVDAVVAIAAVAPPDQLDDWATEAHRSARDTHRAVTGNRDASLQRIRQMRDTVAPDPIEGMLAAFGDGGSASDVNWLHEPSHRTMFDTSLREALRPGPHGWHDDEIALHQPWGFDLRDIDVPVHFLHGTADTIAPLSHARQMVTRIRHATLDEVPDVGHLAVLAHLDRFACVIATASAHHHHTTTSCKENL